ncbi:MAG: hypothetical protein V7K27_05215 [Nostoc sp.]|uniref:hypothetical protein n=1 Tax=Nostoc sp. TaxID=1180 RepID=UPI002FF4E007
MVTPHSWWHIPDDISNVITLKEACKKYHYTRKSIIRKIYNQQLQGFKLGRRWYVVPSELGINTRVRKKKDIFGQ